jgi:hypothetical protein
MFYHTKYANIKGHIILKNLNSNEYTKVKSHVEMLMLSDHNKRKWGIIVIYILDTNTKQHYYLRYIWAYVLLPIGSIIVISSNDSRLISCFEPVMFSRYK